MIPAGIPTEIPPRRLRSPINPATTGEVTMAQTGTHHVQPLHTALGAEELGSPPLMGAPRVVSAELQQTVLVTRVRAARVEADHIVVRTADLQNAGAVWMIVAFFVSYLSLPALAQLTGLLPGALSGLPAAIPSFMFMLLATFVGVGVLKPELRIPRRAGVAFEHAIPAATLGYFSTWALLHNLVPGLRHFSEFNGVELLAFMGINGVEALLFGVVLGSMTRDRVVGLALGSVFQAAFAALWCGLVL